MNPALKRFVEHCYDREVEPFAVYDGLEGLIDGNIQPLCRSDVAGIVYRGGTVIRSSRSQRFMEASFRRQAAGHLKRLSIEGVVILGGDGSFRAMQLLADEARIALACVPATIDNDVPGSDYALGVDTALNVIRHAIDDIRDTASSFRRAFVIELMGRECGYLTLVSALVSGAEVCLIPELAFDEESVADRLAGQFAEGRTYALAMVCEAVKGGTDQLAALFRKRLNLSCRTTVLGHIQRGGSPTVIDRLRAVEWITLAIDGLLEQPSPFALLHRDGQFVSCELTKLPREIVSIKPDLLRLAERLAR